MAVIDVYTSIDEAPLDAYSTPDHVDKPDNQKLPHRPMFAAPSFGGSAIVAKPVNKNLVMQFHHDLKKGTAGRDVVGAKRAIWRANGLAVPAKATPLFGPTAVQQLKVFQHAHGLKADGVLGEGTLKKLAPWFDRYAFLLYEGYPPSSSAEQQRRNGFVAYMMWGYNYRALLGYSQARPMDNLDELEHLPDEDDCSEFFTKGAKFGGYRDPNNQTPQYNGLGWTGTLAQNGRLIKLDQMRGGDGCLYGPAPEFEHVCGAVTSTRVVGMGSDPGPLLLPWDYRSDLGEVRAYAHLAP